MAVDVRDDVRVLRRAQVLRALAEPVRWQIVERLAEEELCGCHLVQDLGLSQPLVSHHLKVLREAGVVDSERFRQWVYHRLAPDALAMLADELDATARATKTASRHRRPCC
jgi:ArsR family transcriptional regulator